MYTRIAENPLSIRNRWGRMVTAVMYTLTLFALVYAFSSSLQGLREPDATPALRDWTSQALWFSFVVLVVVPTSPLIQAMIADFSFSPAGVRRRRLRQLEGEVGRAFDDARRRDRSARLTALISVSRRVVELSKSGASADKINAEWAGFVALLSDAASLVAAEGEVDDLMRTLTTGADLTDVEVKRFRNAMSVAEEIGRADLRVNLSGDAQANAKETQS
ncbi:hypothetical protein GCM10009588_31890 [Microbacterium phyllosphaerae]